MFVTFSPEGQDQQKWEFDPKRVRASAAEAIEKKFGGTWDAFNLAIVQGSMRARRILLWHLQRQSHAALRLEDVDFAAAELEVQFSQGELRELRDQVLAAKSITDDQREMALARLDAELETAPVGDDEGKASLKAIG